MTQSQRSRDPQTGSPYQPSERLPRHELWSPLWKLSGLNAHDSREAGQLEVSLPSFWAYLSFSLSRAVPSRHTEAPRLGVELELQLLIYATATVT